MMFYLRKLTLQTHGVSSFDSLPVPFRAVATDVENGEMVVLTKGDLAEALRASMAIPGAFAPQEIDGRLLVDGFLSQNLPVSVAREWGADVIIAVDVGAPLYTRDELKSILKFTGQTLAMMSRKNTKEQIALLRPEDVLIQPDLGTIRGLNFERSAEAISLAEQAAHKALNSLHRYSVAEQNYAAWRTAQRRRMTAAWMEGLNCGIWASCASVLSGEVPKCMNYGVSRCQEDKPGSHKRARMSGSRLISSTMLAFLEADTSADWNSTRRGKSWGPI